MSAGLLLAAILLLGAHLATVVIVLLRPARPRPGGGAIPATARITLLRPVCGRDAFDEETLASSFRQDWPDYEVVFCAPSADDPATPVVRQLIAAHPQVPARLLTGQERISGNPKLDNLWKGWAATDAPWVCMADSNLLLPPDYLRTLAACWDARTGLVSSPAWGARPEGWAGHLECAFLNGNQARLQLVADSLGIGFAQGKTLFWNRAFLESAGGLAPLGLRLAEDVSATRLVRARGLRVRLTPRPFAQPIGRRSLRQVWDRQLRWSRVRRDGFPAIFLCEVANGAALPALLLVLAGQAALLPAWLVLWYGAEWLLLRRCGWPAGWRDAVAMPLRDALIPAIWITTFARRDITWRGTAMAAPARGGGGR
jgi:ceramide glucosyltransferase